MNTSNGNQWRYHYTMADHLGNTRVEFVAHDGAQPEVVQASSYYPFGMTLRRNDYGSRNVNKRLYGGKELQDQTLVGIALNWYDFEARMYDPTIGRFLQTDPKEEKYFNVSPYTYCLNNPLILIDPSGQETEEVETDDWFENEETGAVYYNANMHKGDEGTGDMKGSGWKWLGPNGMFTNGEFGAEVTLIAQNNGRIGNLNMSLMLEPETAKSFMAEQGYQQVPVQTIEYSYSYSRSESTSPGHNFNITYGECYRYWEKIGYVPYDFVQVSRPMQIGLTLYGKAHAFPFYMPQVSRQKYSYGEPNVFGKLFKGLKIMHGYHDYMNYYNCGSIYSYKNNGGGNNLIDDFLKKNPK